MGTLVVGGSDCFESLLASSVPDLHLHGFAVHVECPDFEVDPNGGQEGIAEDLVTESQQEGALQT